MVKNKFRSRCFLDVKIGSDSVGRIVLELFNELCPKASENFKKLCQGGCGLGLKTGKPLNYQGSVFHRVIKGFMIQGGDFSNGDGTGGESIYGGTFADECLATPHDRPFLLSMANRGPNTNGSQFFITTAPASHLDGKHVVFGHVLSGEDVVRKIEGVPIADTKSHRPVKAVVIEGCGELIPVKKKKLKEEKKIKRKNKKEKKKRTELNGSSDSSEQFECSVRAEEVPEVPAPKFLYRGNIETDRKVEAESKRSPSPRHIAEAVGREILRATLERPSDRSGRKVKGRGRLCYRSPDSQSGTRGRSVTPPHWRQASQNIFKMDHDDWKRWHHQRANEARETQVHLHRSPKPVPVKEKKPPSPPSPSSAVASARNRSPSASPPIVEGAVASRPALCASSITRKGGLSSTSRRSRSSESGASLSPNRRVQNISQVNTLRYTKSPAFDRSPRRDSRERTSKPANGAVLDDHRFSKNQSPNGSDESMLNDQRRRYSHSSRGGYESHVDIEAVRKPNEIDRSLNRSPVLIHKKSHSPPRYTAASSANSPPHKRTVSPQPQLHLNESAVRNTSSPVNLRSVLDVPSRAPSNLQGRSVKSPRRPLCSPRQQSSTHSSNSRIHNQSPPSAPYSMTSGRIRQPVSPVSIRSSSELVKQNICQVLDDNPHNRSSGNTGDSADSQLKQTKTPPFRLLEPLRPSPPRNLMSDIRACRNKSRSGSSSVSDKSPSNRSRSREKPRKLTQPPSPPAHLVQKWRMRHEQLLQKRRIAPSISSAFHTPSLSSEDRCNYFERRGTVSGRPRPSRSRSDSRSPPRQAKVRSSTSHSRSGSPSTRRSRPAVGLNRRGSVHVSSRSGSSGSEEPEEPRLKSKSPSASQKEKVRHQATSPVKVPKRSRKKNTAIPMAAENDPVDEGNVGSSKWEQSEEMLAETESSQRKAWTTSHWQTDTDQSKTITSNRPLVKSDIQGSVLERLRMAQACLSGGQPDTVEMELTSDPPTKPSEVQVAQPASDEPFLAATSTEVTDQLSKAPCTAKSEQPKKLRNRSSSSSSSVDSSASSSSGATSLSRSRSHSRRSPNRRSVSPFLSAIRRRSDFSDSRSRGRGSYYGRYSPISRSRYSRSRSRSFSTYRSTIRSAYSSNRTRRRSSSGSRSRSYTRDSRSPSSRWAPSSRGRYSSSHRRHNRRSHRYSGFRRPSSSRSRSSSRSYSSSPRRR